MTVILIVVDGLGARSVTPDVMPTLVGWGTRGLIRPDGATSVMCASTYPNHASIVTGQLPAAHRMFTNQVVMDGVTRSGAELGPCVPTFLDAGAEVVVGDQNLIGVVSGYTAGRHWPPSGEIPPGTDLDDFGYVSDEEVTAQVVEAIDRRPELLYAQLNGPDTAAHIHGPDSDEAIDSYRSLDRCLAIIDSAMQLHWDQDLVIVTSDHDQETIDPSKRIDLRSLAYQRGVDVEVIHEGTAAMLVGPDASPSAWLDEEPGVERSVLVGGDVHLVFSDPGWWFADSAFPDFHGAHGGPRTTSTVAVAAGSTEGIAAIRPWFRGSRLGAEDWFDQVQVARSISGPSIAAGTGIGSTAQR
ncbi:MAG: alkaline phosphatase family protein [Actinobacteria bacterium]|nr:alkaline phosphatase family protein [Actinomycetota bacterium]